MTLQKTPIHTKTEPNNSDECLPGKGAVGFGGKKAGITGGIHKMLNKLFGPKKNPWNRR